MRSRPVPRCRSPADSSCHVATCNLARSQAPATGWTGWGPLAKTKELTGTPSELQILEQESHMKSKRENKRPGLTEAIHGISTHTALAIDLARRASVHKEKQNIEAVGTFLVAKCVSSMFVGKTPYHLEHLTKPSESKSHHHSKILETHRKLPNLCRTSH